MLVFFTLRFSFTQTLLGNYATDYLSKELKTDFTISQVLIQPNGDVYLKDIYIEDLHQDTLFYAEELISSIAHFNSQNRISETVINKPVIKVRWYKGEDSFNYQYLIDYFAGNNQAENTSNVNSLDSNNQKNNPSINPIIIESLNINNGKIVYELLSRKRGKPAQIDYDYIGCSNLNLRMENLTLGDNFTADINHLSAVEKSGFILDSLNAFFIYTPSQMIFDKLNIITPSSSVKSKHLAFNFKSMDDFNDFENKVNMLSDFEYSNLNLKDLSYFDSFFDSCQEKVSFKGRFNGIVNDFKTQNLFLKLNSETEFTTDLHLTNATNITKLKYNAFVYGLKTNYSGLSQIPIPPFSDSTYLDLPIEVKYFGNFRGSGNIEGNENKVNHRLNLLTDIGGIKTKGNIYSDTTSQNTIVKGIYDLNDFKSEPFTGLSSLEESDATLDMTLEVNEKNQISIVGEGKVLSTHYYDQTYEDIDVLYSYKNDIFYSTIKSNSNKLNLECEVTYKDYKGQPQISGTANIDKVNINNFGLFKDSLINSITGDLIFNLLGSNIDNISGTLAGKNIVYSRGKAKQFIKKLSLNISEDEKEKEIDLKSDILNLRVNGEYKFNEIKYGIEYVASKILPTLFDNLDTSSHQLPNLEYEAYLKDVGFITQNFAPAIAISKNTLVSGKLYAQNKEIKIYYVGDTISISGVVFHNPFLDLHNTKNKAITLNFESSTLQLAENIGLDNLKLNAKVQEDNIHTKIKWLDNDSSNYGQIEGDGYWFTADYFEFNVFETRAHFQNKDWKLNQDENFPFISINSNQKIVINDFHLTNNLEEDIAINGIISDNKSDILQLDIHELNLSSINALMQNSEIHYDGFISANFCIKNVFDNIVAEADASINNLKLDNKLIGDIYLNSQLDQSTEVVNLTGSLIKNETKTFDFTGNFNPKDKQNALDIICKFEHTNLNFLNAFSNEFISDLDGDVSGDINIKGSFSKPRANGKLSFERTFFKIDLLNTYYDIEGDIFIETSHIYTKKDIQLYDLLGNEAILSADITHRYFEDILYDINIEIPDTISTPKKAIENRFMVLNTNKNNDELFYGTGFIAGKVQLKGTVSEPVININASTKKGTDFVLPMYGSTEVQMEDYIHFVSDSNEEVVHQVDLAGITMNFDLDITPEAKFKMVFDDIYGDQIEGTGKGKLIMKVEDELFDMNGQIEVVSGDYLFTLSLSGLENIINKKFTLKPGGTISWYGDPYDAYLDIEAIYKLRVSPYNIMPAVIAPNYKSRTDVECVMHLSQSLESPNINFDIIIPRADEQVKNAVTAIVQDEQQLNQQVFSLLLLNRFLKTDYADNEATSGSNVGLASASELLSNQISNWLSGISDKVDLGINYNPGDELNSDDYGLSLSTSLFNDRLLVSGNVGISTANEVNNKPNTVIGDVNVEYKLNQDGTFRVKVFTRTNNDDVLQNNQLKGQTTQGVGFLYTEDYDKVNESKLFKWLFKKKKK